MATHRVYAVVYLCDRHVLIASGAPAPSCDLVHLWPRTLVLSPRSWAEVGGRQTVHVSGIP